MFNFLMIIENNVTMKQKQLRKQHRYGMGIVPIASEKEEFSKNGNHRFVNNLIQKVLIAAILISVFSAKTFAQVQWGVKLGANASTQSEIGNICDDNHLRVGFNGGIIAKVQMNDWMALKLGLDYQLKGKKCDISGEDSKLENKLSYLVLPVKAEFSASEKAGFKNGQRLFFATGPYAGYLLNAKQTTNGQTTDIDNLNDIDFGWTFELGFEFPILKSNALQVSLNYDMGLKELAEDTDIQNKTASLNLGFLF